MKNNNGGKQGVTAGKLRNISNKKEKPSFLHLKEIMVNLSLEIEDMNRTGELLLAKLKEEKRGRFGLKQEIAAEWGPKLKQAADEQKKSTETQLSMIDKLVSEKKNLSEECRQLLERIKREQMTTQRKIERIKEEGQEEIASAKRSWAEGEGVRRERWLARKAKEAKDLTLQGLQPEVEHLMHKHRQDEQQLRDQLQLEIAELQRLMQTKTTEAVEAEKKKLRSKFEDVFKTIKLEENERVNEINKDHEHHMQILRQRCEKEMASQREWQDQELKRLEERHVGTQSGLRQEEAEALHDLRERQRREQDALVARHTKDLKAVRVRAQKEMEEWRQVTYQKLKEEELSFGKKDEETIIKERDSKIDAHIRHLQKKAKEEKRGLKVDHEDELIRLTEEVESEMERSRRRHTEYQRKLDACQSSIETHLQKKEGLESSIASMNDELKGLQKTLQAKHVDFSEQQSGAMHEDAKMLEEQRTVREEIQRKINEAKLEADRKESELREMKDRHSSMADWLQQGHEQKLHNLDASVKKMMEEKELRIAQLQDEIHTEQIRRKRMQKLFEKYSLQKH